MSIASLEKEIVAHVQVLVCNPKFKRKDIMEWSTGEVTPAADEVTVYDDILRVTVCLKKTADKRDL